MEKPRILGIVGPTASGKTALGFALAEVRSIEIVCMDSMQVYKGMDIGTAKPSREEQALIPHHMLDVAEPEDEYSVAEYLSGAAAVIEGILSRGRLPILVGGTGLYLRALSQGLTLGGAPKDEAVRARYEALLAEEGPERLHRKLQEVDPDAAARRHPNNTRRVIRAREVYEVTGRPFSGQKTREVDAPFDIRLFAPDWPRDELYARVDQRAHGMLRGGLLDEVRALL
ncbi:MAG: tRNA (adenosine(37)-N6)-dimethylallyltransferase MiaA, partial [Clostridiales bacterium]|nr:tRNA (adenosine(37)-N6)-dimethylallyltransferase MiaA [Clostridiales bacterium]